MFSLLRSVQEKTSQKLDYDSNSFVKFLVAFVFLRGWSVISCLTTTVIVLLYAWLRSNYLFITICICSAFSYVSRIFTLGM